MSTYIEINEGTYRKQDCSGMTFELVKQFERTDKSNFVTVRNGGNFPNCPDTIRITVDGPMSYQFTGESTEAVRAVAEAEVRAVESDEVLKFLLK